MYQIRISNNERWVWVKCTSFQELNDFCKDFGYGSAYKFIRKIKVNFREFKNKWFAVLINQICYDKED